MCSDGAGPFSRPLSSRLSYFALLLHRPPSLKLYAQSALSLVPLRRRGASLVLAFYPIGFFTLPFRLCFSQAQCTRSVGAGPRHPLSRRGASLVLAFYPIGFFTLPFLLCFSPAQSARGGPFAKPFLLGKKIYLLKPRRFSVAQQNSKFQS